MRWAAAVSTFALVTSLVATGARASDAPRRALLVPPLDGPDVVAVGEERDGTRRLIAYGVRVLARPDGEGAGATELLPVGKRGLAVRLPQPRGSGLLFAG